MPAAKASAPKRKAPASAASATSSKKAKTAITTTTDPLRAPHPFHEIAEEHGIVLRKYYPHEMSNARARAYASDALPRPIEVLHAALAATAAARKAAAPGAAVVHWFKTDLRVRDNRALHLAAARARDAKVPLLALYVVSPQDWEAHLMAPVRVDFVLRSLAVLRQDLAALDVPLWIETVEDRREVPPRVAALMRAWDANHLFANMEYEVDELRREAKLVRLLAGQGCAFEVVHDTCVVRPGALASGAGRQYAVYTPWFKAWRRHVEENPDETLALLDPPGPNPPAARETFARLFAGGAVPEAPEGKRLSADDAKKYAALYPAGEHEAEKRLEKFCQERVEGYAKNRNFPNTPGTSSLSVHLAAGTLSARTAVRTARAHNRTKKLDAGSEGIQVWISEVAWRDFYRHVLVNWPYVWYLPSPDLPPALLWPPPR